MIDYVGAIRRDSARFRAVLGGTAPETRVPSCPEWDASELLWHLTEVQMFWRLIVEHRLQDPGEAESMKRARPESYADHHHLFDVESARLVTALETADPAERVWSWYDDGWSVGWIRRRQAHEALIHRVDAELAAGTVTALEPVLAADGIDEILRVMIDPIPVWARFEPDGLSALLEATDTGARWAISFGRFLGTSPDTGNAFDLDMLRVLEVPPAGPDVTVRGGGGPLDAWLWGRGNIDDLVVEGDQGLAGRIRTIAAASTQ